MLPLGVVMFVSLQCRQIGPPDGRRDSWTSGDQEKWMAVSTSSSNSSASLPPSLSGGGSVSISSMLREANVQVDMVRKGTYGRRSVRSMSPRYITIHSTQNYSADAERHSVALKRGALRTNQRPGYLIWHYTVDDHVAIQHMPTNEQGVHADFNGPGNRFSIGIEMCEHRGCSREATLERTAKLTAVLMKRNNIPLRNVVPHYHWPRKGKNPPNKNCPHFLLENGKPGKKWRAFQARVNYYYQRLG